MKDLLDIIDSGDVCALGLLIVITIMAGAAMIGANAGLKVWGQRIAAGAFVLYLIYGFAQFEPSSAEDWVYIAFRGVLAAGLALGFSWITLAVGNYCWIRSFGHFLARLHAQRQQARQRRAQDRSSRQQAIQEQHRGEEEKWQRESESDARKKRDSARAKATRAYHLLKHRLNNRFTDNDFSVYLKTFLSDRQLPADVEHHASKLIQTLKQLAEHSEEGQGKRSLHAINERFQERKAEIASADTDDELKHILIVDLEEQYEEEVRRHIREGL